MKIENYSIAKVNVVIRELLGIVIINSNQKCHYMTLLNPNGFLENSLGTSM